MRLLSPKLHGCVDYLTSAGFALAPMLFMIKGVTPAVMGCYVISAGLLLMSFVTRYPLGVVRLVPFQVHGALELLGTPVIVAYPWIAGFDHVPAARNFYVVAGLALFLLWLITDYRAAERPEELPVPDGGVPQKGQRI
jgi:hypothetical protein